MRTGRPVHAMGAKADGTGRDGSNMMTTTTTTRLPSAASIGLSRTRVEVKQFFRERDAVIFTFLFPIALLGIFSVVFGGDTWFEGSGVDVPTYYTPGMVAAGILLSSFQTLAMSLAIERDDLTLKRLRGTPMPAMSFFLGKIGLVIFTSVLQVTLLLAVARLAFGVDLPTEPARWLTFGWVFLLGTAAGSVLGIAFSVVPKSARSAGAVITPVVLVLQFISGVFFVYSELPTWLQHVAEVFPLKWIAQGMRSVFLPEDFTTLEVAGSWQHGLTALVLGSWLVVGLLLSVRYFTWMRRDAG